jgi:hypothetical protein
MMAARTVFTASPAVRFADVSEPSVDAQDDGNKCNRSNNDIYNSKVVHVKSRQQLSSSSDSQGAH